jgi:hypothetical protein
MTASHGHDQITNPNHTCSLQVVNGKNILKELSQMLCTSTDSCALHGTFSLKTESDDLCANGMNNMRNVYEQTGFHHSTHMHLLGLRQ